ncbi:DUF418 domain-containing protein [Nocardiopsis ansamitocini]|uniref:DUF418 domain-containing protein n=1 Tax=Nocardiopsis ansamitocini TaxID=1670832 RepID=A0A9W6UHF5_9ACTN|nr:DUF418 domain-containing protein [Nocardiopsis ansamitocini]GLU46682.1 hypothetical protein Nans01_10330 [Nocardiopsis ansamitocini]
MTSRDELQEAPAPRRRIDVLDVLRGFALCGILLVNIQPVTHMGYGMSSADLQTSGQHLAPQVLNLLVAGRFMPVFAFLFGVGFALFLDSASARTASPRWVLARRLTVLGVLGFAHGYLHPGEALLPYAVAGLVVLLPASYLPRWLVLAGGTIACVLGVTVVNGGISLIPGLFLLGLAVTRYGVWRSLPQQGTALAITFVVFVATAVPAAYWQFTELSMSGFSHSSAVAGLLMAGVYVTGLCLLMRTRLSGLLHAVFAPLGRMALTNYLSATVMVVVAGWLLDFESSMQWGALFVLAGVVLMVQWGWSTLWLRRFRYGPAEWVWRCLTWWELVDNLRPAESAANKSARLDAGA